MTLLYAVRKIYMNKQLLRFNSTKATNNIDFCLSMIRKRDYDNYLCILLLPSSLRLAATTMRALNIELAMIQEVTTEPRTSKARMDFWKKNVEQAILGRPPNHPVLTTLSLCMEHYGDKISSKWVNRLVDVREKYLNSRSFMSLDDAEDYGEYSVSSIFYILLEANDNSDSDLIQAASHLGKAISFVTLLRSVSYFREHSKVILPTEVLMRHNVKPVDIIKKRKEESIREVVFDISSDGHIHLEKCTNLIKKKDKSNIFLPLIPCEDFYRHIQRLNFDIFNENLGKRNWTMSFKLLLASLKR